MRWPDGVVARAYIEHVIHVCDLRDVPVQRLVEAGGALPGEEREKARKAQACVRCRGCGLEAMRLRDGAVARSVL